MKKHVNKLRQMKGWYKREWAWRLANRKPLSTSGLIPEKLCVGEEEPHWCLPARFYSSSSISVWASHTGCPCSFCHFITPPSLCPPIKHLSQHVLGYMCVFGCIRSPAGCVNSGRRVKRERSLRSQSCGSSLAWLSPGVFIALGGKHKACTKHGSPLSSPSVIRTFRCSLSPI